MEHEEFRLKPFTRLYFFYKDLIFPWVKSVRGTTRLSLLLESLASREIEVGFDVVEKRDLKYFLAERDYIKRFCESVDEGSVVADVGGYHGLCSLVAGNEGARVYCFEPSPENYPRANDNFTRNGMDIRLFRNAVWSELDVLTIEYGRGGSNQVGKGRRSVDALTLDSVFSNPPYPDVIKIDVEGAEGHVLEGAEELLDSAKPKLFIEFHNNGRIEEFGHEFHELLEFLDSKGYKPEFGQDRGGEVLMIWV